MKIVKDLLINGIRFYQKYLSPLKAGPTCKFYPTCSVYAVEAIEKHGAIKGTLLAVWRILRCNPFSKGGYDMVVVGRPNAKGRTFKEIESAFMHLVKLHHIGVTHKKVEQI